jgi:hypothetical protein
MDETNAGDDATRATPATGAVAPSTSDRPVPTGLLAFGAVAVVVLVVGLIVWIMSGDSDDTTSQVTTPASAPVSTATTTPATAESTTTSSATSAPTTSTTTSTTSTTPSTTSTTTSTTPTTEPPEFALPEPGAPEWNVTLQTGQQLTLSLAASDGDVGVYDGVGDGLRCVGVVGPAQELTSWCGTPDVAATLVADRGLEALVVALPGGSEGVALSRQPAGWTLASNGCATPMATILAAARPGASAVTTVICAGDEAFVGIGSSLIGPDTAPDGGGILVVNGDEGWNPVAGFDTSAPCGDWPDGIDRCASFGVGSDLFEALLPVAPNELLGGSAVNVVSVTDQTGEVTSWVGDATDIDTITSLVTARLVDPEAEVVATVRSGGPLQDGRYELIVVEIPQFDDAFAFETWAVWVAPPDAGGGVQAAFSWGTCTRGVTGDGLCV